MIYLAAGLSSRYGSNKLLAEVDGKPMYRHLLDILTVMKEEEPHRFELVVVTAYDEIEEALQGLPLKVVRNHHQELGASHSIKLGLEACGEIGRHDHVMFAVADQPYVQEDELFGFIHMYKRSYTLDAKERNETGDPAGLLGISRPAAHRSGRVVP